MPMGPQLRLRTPTLDAVLPRWQPIPAQGFAGLSHKISTLELTLNHPGLRAKISALFYWILCEIRPIV